VNRSAYAKRIMTGKPVPNLQIAQLEAYEYNPEALRKSLERWVPIFGAILFILAVILLVAIRVFRALIHP